MNLDQIEDAMISELSKSSQPSTQNQLRLLQQQYPNCRDSILMVFNRYKDLCHRFKEDDILRPAANMIIREKFMTELLREDIPNKNGSKSDLLNPVVDVNDASLLKYETTRDKLAKDIGLNGTVAAYAPIIPLCTPGLMREKLNQRGIRNMVYEKYVVLESQLVVGISNELMTQKLGAHQLLKSAFDAISAEGKACAKLEANRPAYIAAIMALRSRALAVTHQMKSSKDIASIEEKLREQKVSIKDDGSADEVALTIRSLCVSLNKMIDMSEGPTSERAVLDRLIKSVSKSIGKKLIEAASPVSYLEGRWMWLTTNKELSDLTASSMGGHCVIKKWALAFNARPEPVKK